MYAIKPWGRAALVGNTVGSCVLGIGMRWRETVVDIFEKKSDPFYETAMMERCVIPQNAARLMLDLGVTEKNLYRWLKPAGKWKFVTHSLDTMREGDAYPGCAPSEQVFHVTKGRLVRCLRQEFLRFGGTVSWQTQAFDPFDTGDSSGLWSLRKEWGTQHEIELAVNFAKANLFFHPLLFEKTKIPHVSFNIQKGVSPVIPEELKKAFGQEFDFIIVLGKEMALHIYRPNNEVLVWNCVWKEGRQQSDGPKSSIEQLHPALRLMLSKTPQASHDVIRLPVIPPTFIEAPAADNRRLSVAGSSMMPIDVFSWRGDDALMSIEESAALVDRLYRSKYQRGSVVHELREFEQDCLIKRFNLVQRDLKDAEMFLSASPELPSDADGEEGPKTARVST